MTVTSVSCRRALLVGALLLLGELADACTVRYVAPGGDDASTGCTPAAPLQTVGACVGLATHNDTCYLFPGTYREATPPPGGHVVTGVANLTIALAPEELWPVESDERGPLDVAPATAQVESSDEDELNDPLIVLVDEDDLRAQQILASKQVLTASFRKNYNVRHSESPRRRRIAPSKRRE